MVNAPRTAQETDGGFTLVELLIVIIILAILAAIVIFAVGGISDKGQSAACQQDARTLEAAEEAYFAQNSSYVVQGGLVPTYIHQQSSWYDASVAPGGHDYQLTLTAAGAAASCPANP